MNNAVVSQNGCNNMSLANRVIVGLCVRNWWRQSRLQCVLWFVVCDSVNKTSRLAGDWCYTDVQVEQRTNESHHWYRRWFTCLWSVGCDIDNYNDDRLVFCWGIIAAFALCKLFIIACPSPPIDNIW